MLNFVRESDCLIMIGADIKSSLVKKIVCEHLDKEYPVIEIDKESGINRGNNIQVLGDQNVTEVVPALFQEYYRLLSLD